VSLIMPSVGEVRALELLVGQAAPDNLTLHLFANDVKPSLGDTVETYQEVSGGGYVSKILDGNTWLISGGSPAVAEYPPQEFLFSAPPDRITVFGYFILQSGELLWAERFQPESDFTPPFIVTGLGDRVVITPVFMLRSVD
jgi:hypothetical protein